MVRATWNGVTIAESEATVVVEGNHYFPISDVRRDVLRPSSRHTICPWKGVASYYDVVVGDRVNRDAAWFYPDPKSAAKQITGRVAFWHGVRVETSRTVDSARPTTTERGWLRRLLAR
jgi:uncharacterized protein (DUF427 family)